MAGEIVPDEVVMQIDGSLQPGTYNLKVGLYDSATPAAFAGTGSGRAGLCR